MRRDLLHALERRVLPLVDAMVNRRMKCPPVIDNGAGALAQLLFDFEVGEGDDDVDYALREAVKRELGLLELRNGWSTHIS